MLHIVTLTPRATCWPRQPQPRGQPRNPSPAISPPSRTGTPVRSRPCWTRPSSQCAIPCPRTRPVHALSRCLYLRSRACPDLPGRRCLRVYHTGVIWSSLCCSSTTSSRPRASSPERRARALRWCLSILASRALLEDDPEALAQPDDVAHGRRVVIDVLGAPVLGDEPDVKIP